MKLNIECMRDVLVSMDRDFNLETTTLEELSRKIPQWSRTEIEYSVLKLTEGKFIYGKESKTPKERTWSCVDPIYGVTRAGYNFLFAIKNETVWKEIKNEIERVGGFTTSIIQKLGEKILRQRYGVEIEPVRTVDVRRKVELPLWGSVCIARHFKEMHESMKDDRKPSFAKPCEGCVYLEICARHKFPWVEITAPILDIDGLHIDLLAKTGGNFDEK